MTFVDHLLANVKNLEKFFFKHWIYVSTVTYWIMIL